MTTATIGIGVPGSGKTTVLKQLQAVYICPDDIREEMTGDSADQSKNAKVWTEAYRRIHAALDEGRNVVVDATNANARDRRHLVGYCREKASAVHGIWFVTPLGVCVKRNNARPRTVPEEVIGRMYEQLRSNPPSLSEGFTTLERVSAV